MSLILLPVKENTTFEEDMEYAKHLCRIAKQLDDKHSLTLAKKIERRQERLLRLKQGRNSRSYHNWRYEIYSVKKSFYAFMFRLKKHINDYYL